MNEREERIKCIKEQIEALPNEAQGAIGWLIENIDLVDEMSQGEKFTQEEISTFTRKALEMKDYIMLAMVMYKQKKDQAEAEIQQKG